MAHKNGKLKEALTGKRVLITGGLGMIGSCIAHELVEYDANITIVDACIEPYGANMFNIKDIRDKVTVNIADIRDKEAMKVLVRDQDYIFNLAGQVSHNDSLENPMLDADINYIGHLNVAENVRLYNPNARILYSGSRLQFGRIQYNPVDEQHPMQPKTPYAFNKAVAEDMYRFYHEVHDVRSTVFRIANPYGIRSQMKHAKYSIINFFIRLATQKQKISIFGDGTQLRDYIYVKDLARAFVAAAAYDDEPYQVYNVGSGQGTAFADMVHMVVDLVGSGEVEYIPWPENYLNVETGDHITDITKITTLLDWEPQYSLLQGITETVEYYKQHGQHYFQ